ncbi:hypothetical protein [Tychonema sp. LEGE 07203]|uniref:hypothetical protein n=1 Tax=Tychonema sp. LEGE 07203 TaxID=1828671 RepID=UPI0018819405|nr:hypothetical protein [Tychonema sp. LEGE 07203]MBE9095569.1 hypothetical protein [Tychonema sp. LEGE 07203]
MRSKFTCTISPAKKQLATDSYQAGTSQNTALIWLQSQVYTSVLGGRTQKFRITAVPKDNNLRSIDAGKFDRAFAQQKPA